MCIVVFGLWMLCYVANIDSFLFKSYEQKNGILNKKKLKNKAFTNKNKNA
jgi:hypothetical protein